MQFSNIEDIRMKVCFYFLITLLLCYSRPVFAQDGKAFSIPVEASVQNGANPSITLSWNTDNLAIDYQIYRKEPTENSWFDQTAWGKVIATLPKTTTTFTDDNIVEGVLYEYQIVKRCSPEGVKTLNLGNGNDTVTTYLGTGYVYAGINVPPQLHRGTVLIFVDSTVANPLSAEIANLEQDLNNELWHVKKFLVARTTSFDAQPVHAIKQIIKEQYDANTDEKYAVLLLGRVAVPYSGSLYPDGHPDHNGAWPADVFYGDIDGEWTDNTVDNTKASRPENKNIPDDGKFDKSELEADIRIPVGRVDFYNLTSFKESEVELLRRYLNKNHAFRSGQIKPTYAAIVDDNFGAYGEGFSGSAYRGFGPLVGKDNFKPTTEFLDSTQNVMFAYGCGAGSFTSCSGVGGITEFSTRSINSTFTTIFGSYFGDWDSKDNVMRSVVASRGTVLTTGWAARPHWFFHPMGMGFPVGDVLTMAQNNTQQYLPTVYYTKKITGGILYHVAPRGTHIALIGDPTLRMTSNLPIEAPTNVGVVNGGADAMVSWSASPSATGYLVSKANTKEGPFTLITPNPITGLSFSDNTAKKGENVVYQVRSVALRSTKSGTFYEASLPVTTMQINVGIPEEQFAETQLICAPMPMSDAGSLSFSMPSSAFAEIGIYTLDGRLISMLYKGALNEGSQSLIIPAHAISPGMYMVRLKSPEHSQTTPLIISR